MSTRLESLSHSSWNYRLFVSIKMVLEGVLPPILPIRSAGSIADGLNQLPHCNTSNASVNVAELTLPARLNA